ncbi:tyrosine-type recombinase/integrase [Xanthomonas citri]|uniref:tyrosine-type recombinase/integrase n=1 Tax=Xanthomonas citri TaxID=346 RepID=UPI0004E76EAD|nr:site-specific integrase [Xanthomonas citri]PNV30529.1 site-specific integrase [Xanthomonas citri]WPM74839.1 site-specific integrase [Xanthomonas citri pv. viticola]
MATFEKRTGTSGKVTWRVRVRRQSGPWLTKSFDRKIDAQEWARSIEHKLDVGDFVPSTEVRKRTVGDAIYRYLEVTLPAKRQKDAAKQIQMLAWWKAEIGDVPLVGLTPAKIAAIRDRLAAGKVRGDKLRSGSTINRRLASLSAVMSVTVKEYGWLTKNPVPNVTRMQESKGRERFLSEPERLALLAACDASDCAPLAPLVRLALATGARRGELLGLQWEHVDLDRRTARFIDTKNGENRTVPLATGVTQMLQAMPRTTGPIFPITGPMLDKPWRAACVSAGLGDFRFHDLRHSAASYLAMSGASLMDIAAILGHKTLAMVKRYSHLSEQHTKSAIDRMAEKFL